MHCQNRSAKYQSSIPFHSYLDSMQIFLAQECLPCCKPYFSAHLGPTTQQSESVSQENEIGHYIPTKSEPPIIFVHPAFLLVENLNEKWRLHRKLYCTHEVQCWRSCRPLAAIILMRLLLINVVNDR